MLHSAPSPLSCQVEQSDELYKYILCLRSRCPQVNSTQTVSQIRWGSAQALYYPKGKLYAHNKLEFTAPENGIDKLSLFLSPPLISYVEELFQNQSLYRHCMTVYDLTISTDKESICSPSFLPLMTAKPAIQNALHGGSRGEATVKIPPAPVIDYWALQIQTSFFFNNLELLKLQLHY